MVANRFRQCRIEIDEHLSRAAGGGLDATSHLAKLFGSLRQDIWPPTPLPYRR